MEFKIFLGVIVFASTIAWSAADCSLTNRDNSCNYTITCTSKPSRMTNPDCEEDSYVIFSITNTNIELLDVDFFRSTNFNSRVREIKAYNNSWTNIGTSTFRSYPYIISLDLSNNCIEKINNEAFNYLNNLQTLNISNNKIKTLNCESFLNSRTRGNLVQELDLSNNKLIELSSELNYLPKLKRLHLQNNMLANLADDCFISLWNLEYLNLQNNRLTLLKFTLTKLRMLKTLDISYNNLIKLTGYEINRLVAIVEFNASHNALTSVESNSFDHATSLESVDFSYNNINSTIENVKFVVKNRPIYLNFCNNPIIGLQENYFLHCSKYYINFENNYITGDIKENTFTSLRNITDLDLSGQSVSGIKDKAFTDMVSLTHLNLSTNNIREIENSSFDISSITVLDLSHNQISHLYYLQNCLPNLTELYVNNNYITVVPKTIFDNQSQIRKLDLSMNRIKIIEQYSLPLKSLQYLNIVGNHLSGIIKKNVFSPAKYLRFLDLSNCSITKIDDSAFVDLPVLTRLNLSNNLIETIEPDNFRGVDNMHSLDVSYNNLTHLSFTTRINNLKALYLNNNQLTNISKLIYLDIPNVEISNLTSLGADMFPNLTVFHLSNNQIKYFNYPQINSLTSLIDLGLSSNEISNIDLSHFKELMSVDLSNNNLTYLNSSLFKNNEYLQSLDISRNSLTDLPPGTLKFMKNLKLLNLSSNYLSELRFGSLKGLHKTELLDLSKNYIAVLDVDVFYECDELKTLIIDYNRIKTFDVERLILMRLKKLGSLSLGGNPISCREILHNAEFLEVTIHANRLTSIDKIYDVDNVYGIQCDSFHESTNTKSKVKELTTATPNKDWDLNRFCMSVCPVPSKLTQFIN